MLLSINDKDTDEDLSIKVRSIARKLKRNEVTLSNQSNDCNSESIETNNSMNMLKSKTNRQKEVEKEINLLKNSGLQSPPNKEKSDSSIKTSHSVVTERR